MADGGGAGGGVHAAGPFAAPPDLVAQGGELARAPVEVGDVGVEHPGDVPARRALRLADGDDLAALGQRQTGGLGGLDEREPVQDRRVVVAVAGRGPVGRREQPACS